MTPTRTLLLALRGFLRERVAPQLDGYAAYEIRIAANLLAMLEREARLGPALRSLDAALARDFNLREERAAVDLAVALRDGRVVPDAELVERLRERALLSLAIDNPRYSGAREARRRWPERAQAVDAAVDEVC